jgi:hypothetical protein
MAISAQTPAPRYALIIGNGNYSQLAKLSNPKNDAADIAQALKGLGFQTDLLIDADLVSMEDALQRLGDRLATSSSSIGFFYYAGHGVQSGGINYLIPADAYIVSEPYLKTKALAAQSVLDILQDAKNSLNVVVLDACRDNPFGWSRSGTRGLAVVSSQPPGSIIVYATSAGSVAQDGSGRNGAFTQELLKNISTPGLEIKDVFNTTGAMVQKSTKGKQIPAVYNQFFDSAYLAGNPSISSTPLLNSSQTIAVPSAEGSSKSPAPVITIQNPKGTIVINTLSAGTLFLDDKQMGEVPTGADARIDNIDVGDHIAEMHYAPGLTERSNVTVEKDKTSLLTFRDYLYKKDDSSLSLAVPGEVKLNPIRIVHRTISMTGNANDWEGIEPYWTTPSGTKIALFDQAGAEVTRIYVCRDDSFLYWRIDFASVNPFNAPPAEAESGVVLIENIEIAPNRHLQLTVVNDISHHSTRTVTMIYNHNTKSHQYVSRDHIVFGSYVSSFEAKAPLSEIKQYLADTLKIQTQVYNVDKTGNWAPNAWTPWVYLDFDLQAASAEFDPLQVARDFVEDFMSNDPCCRSLMSESLAVLYPQEKIAETIKQLSSQYGNYQSVSAQAPTLQSGILVIPLSCDFAKATFDVTITFDANRKISAFSMTPQNTASSSTQTSATNSTSNFSENKTASNGTAIVVSPNGPANQDNAKAAIIYEAGQCRWVGDEFTIEPVSGSQPSNSFGVWESSDPSVATVNSSGKVRAISAGVVKIVFRVNAGQSHAWPVAVWSPNDSKGLVQFVASDSSFLGWYWFRRLPVADRDFDMLKTHITARLAKISGSLATGYGFGFCYKDQWNTYLLMISGDGYFRVRKVLNGTWSDIMPWKHNNGLIAGFANINKVDIYQSSIGNFRITFNDNSTASETFTDTTFKAGKIEFYAQIGDASYESFPEKREDIRYQLLAPVKFPF